MYPVSGGQGSERYCNVSYIGASVPMLCDVNVVPLNFQSRMDPVDGLRSMISARASPSKSSTRTICSPLAGIPTKALETTVEPSTYQSPIAPEGSLRNRG
jgi:hypothetical protein